MSKTNQLIVHVVGLQRSGTNYVSELINSFTNITATKSGDQEFFWKHALPHEVNKKGVMVEEVIASSSRLAICLVVKHPLNWFASILRDNADLILIRTELGKFHSNFRLINFWFKFHSLWRNLLETKDGAKFIVVSYEKVLRNPEGFLAQLSLLTGGSVLTSPEFSLAQVPFSRNFSSLERQRYTEGQNYTSNRLIRMIFALRCGKQLLEDLGIDHSHNTEN